MTAKVALVTGASRGIGRAIAEKLLASGRRIIACARDEAALARLGEAYPGRVHALRVDLSRDDAVDDVCDRAFAFEPRIDELVCAAGIVRYAEVGEVSAADLRAQMTVNFVVPYLLAQRLGRHMRDQNAGAILFVASTLWERPARLTSAYAASKAALVNTMRSFALELAPSVRVNALAPGVVDTDMVRVPRGQVLHDAHAREKAVENTLEALRAIHPLGRLGRVDEIADAAQFVLDASWVTGSVLTIDGGLSVG